MKPTINISVSRPCSEKFNQFNKTEKGGFCNSCQKEVIDFRNMRDDELINFFKNRTENTCGYFKSPQLKAYSVKEEPAKNHNFKYLRAVGFAFFSMISLHGIQAQSQSDAIEVVESTESKRDQVKSVITQERLLKGTIADENGPLPGANIVLKGTTIGTSSNFDGEFTFPKILKEDDVLVISYLGYVTKEIKIKKEQTQLNTILNIDMKEDTTCVLMGEVEVNEVYTSKKTLWQKIKGIF